MGRQVTFAACLWSLIYGYVDFIRPTEASQISIPAHSRDLQCGSSDPDYDNEINLSGDGSLKFFFSLTNATDGEALSARITYQKLGWLGFGVSPKGTMPDSQVVIGKPDDGDADPKKYSISGRSGSTIALMEDSMQTLIDASIVQDETTTKLSFVKLLSEPDEYPIDATGTNTFIYAAGGSNTFGFHAKYASFEVDLSQECAEAEVEVAETYQSLWAAHGALAFAAWTVAAPIAILSAISRKMIGAPLWFQIHRALNTACVLVSVAALIVAIIVKSKASSPSHFQTTHHIVGLCIVVVAVLQGVAGYLRPHVEEETTTIRKVWEALHRLFGVTLLGASIWQVQNGITMYSDRFLVQGWLLGFWIWIGVLLVVGIGLKGYFICQTRKSAAVDNK